MTLRTAVVIPCYNSGTMAASVIRKTRSVADLIVAVNDGSQDETARILADSGVVVLTHEQNQGKGAALRTGFAFLLARSDWEAAATLDSDGQHDPEWLPQLLEPLRSSQADLVIGSRQFTSGEIPFLRRFANVASSNLLSLLLKTRTMDLQSGYRVFSRALLQSLYPQLQATGFEIETEMFIRALQAKARIIDIPIPAVYTTPSNRSSHWRGFHDSIRIIRTVFRTLRQK